MGYWWEWSDVNLRNYEKSAVAGLKNNPNYRYHGFVQYLFFDEWAQVKKEINDLGISIIGDIPFYVSGDSADVWASRDLFKMATASGVNKVLKDYEKALDKYKKAVEKGETTTKDGEPLKEPRKPKPEALVFESVAGVPPDYFCADGQL